MRKLILFLLLLIIPTISFAVPITNPVINNIHKANIQTTPVNVYIDFGETSRFDVFFIDLNKDSDLKTWYSYNGWCLDRHKSLDKGWVYEAHLYQSTIEIPKSLKNVEFNKINYLINHKIGDKKDIQDAIWYLIHGNGYLSVNAESMVRNADEFGKFYVPLSGNMVAIICIVDDQQPFFIEYKIPETIIVAAPAPEIILPVEEIPAEYYGTGGYFGGGYYYGGGGFGSYGGGTYIIIPIPIFPPFPIPPNPPFPPNPPEPPIPPPPPEPPEPPPNPVPEPSTMILLGSGLTTMIFFRKKFK
jgi:hypothetical protein